jgi:hypothetical protein
MSRKTRLFVLISSAVLVVGMGTGLVASYLGLPVSLFSTAAAPDELQYVPPDAAVVAYADVREIMNSQFRQRFRELEPQSAEKNEFEAKTGIRIDEDIESVVAAMMPGVVADHPEQGALVLARGRFEPERLEALALERGAVVEEYQGKRIIAHKAGGNDWRLALGFVEADLVALGSEGAVKRAIDAGRENRNVVSNTEMMRLVNELDSSTAWAVGRFDALAKEANLPSEVQSRISTISWFSAAGHVNGGVSGVFKAEAKDEEAAQNLRDIIRGVVAFTKMQSTSQPALKQMADSLQLSGEGKSVAVAFTVPTEVLDLLEAAAKAKKGQ